MRYKLRLQALFIHISLIIVSMVSLFPILWMVLISFKGDGESISGFKSLFLENPTISNYTRLFDTIPIVRNLFNSIFTTLGGTITTLFFSALAGFAFAKYRFPFRDFLFYSVIATMLIPPEIGAVPLFITMRKIGLINSLWSLIIPRMVTAVGVFYMRQYIKSIPDDIIEAARIDGCNDFRIFLTIILPVIKPALASWGIVTLIARWNDFFWPLLYLRNEESYTLMVSLSLLPISDGLSTPWPVILAGTTFAILPIIMLYLILQNFHKSGILSGSVKG